ncbi:hypothetical protein KGD82_27915 (plasmid) [Nocardiopsis eucommiae]|uniref:Uncharacterized protein n=1 Tax=Nocardiopsis eucommiae TaxID=2831970 RepID=A0A975LD75_9ACTN|nr:hypothetical protein KGD82_27915 [Nocardiopsis eucommiae]
MYNPMLNTYAATGFGARKTQTTVTTTPVRGWDGRMDLHRAVARSLRAAEKAHTLPRAITPMPITDIRDAIAEGAITPEEGRDMITHRRADPHRVQAHTHDGVPVDILAATPKIAHAIAAYYANNGKVRITRANRKRTRHAVNEGLLPPPFSATCKAYKGSVGGWQKVTLRTPPHPKRRP